MIRLEGYEISQGSFETDNVSLDKNTGEIVREKMEFNNYILYYSTDDRSGSGPKDVRGRFCESVKAKVDVLRVIGADHLDKCIGKNVMFGFDMSQRSDASGKVKAMVTTVVLLEGGK